MALDLRGFVPPERKFEGLVELARGIGQRKAQEEKQKSEEQKLRQKNNEDVSSAIDLMSDPSKQLSGAASDPLVIKGFSDIRNKAKQLSLENKDITPSALKAALYPDIEKLVGYSTTAKNASKFVEDNIGAYNKDVYDIPKLRQETLKQIFYKPDGTLKELSEVQYTPDVFENVIKTRGTDIVSPAAITSFLKTIPNLESSQRKVVRDSTGKLTEVREDKKWKPWEQEEVDDQGNPTGQYFPRFEIAKDGGNDILHNGQKVKIASDDVFQSVYGSKKEIRDFIDAQARAHAPEFEINGQKLDENSPQVNLLKKAILYDFLEQNRTGKVFEGSKTLAPKPKTTTARSGGGGGGRKPSQTELDRAYDRDTLHAALEEQTPVNGYYDVTPYISQSYMYGKKRFGKNGIKYNPSTKKFKISLVDENGKTVEKQDTYANVFAQLKGSNSGADMTFFTNFESFKPKGAKASDTKPKKKNVGILD